MPKIITPPRPVSFKELPRQERVEIILRMLDGERLSRISKQTGVPKPELVKARSIFRKRNRVQEPEEMRLLTRDEAATILGLRPHTLTIWKCRGHNDLPWVKVGRRVMYKKSDVDAYIEKRARKY